MTNARSLANFATGIGTEGAVLTVDNTNNRIGIATTNPQNDLQVGLGITMEGDTGQVTFVGVITASSFSGSFDASTASFTGDVDIADKIVHTGDTNTAIRFPGNDTFTVETSGSEAFRIDGSQRLLMGRTSTAAVAGRNSNIQLHSNSSHEASITIRRFFVNTDDNAPPRLVLARSGSNSDDSTIVADDNRLGEITFAGADGNDMRTEAANIRAEVDGTPGSDDMPGRLIFSTNAGASDYTERLRITSAGLVGIGTDNPSKTLTIYGASSSSFRISKSGVLAYDHTFDGSTYTIENNNGSAGIPIVIGTKTAGGESLRIDSSGRLLIGTTTEGRAGATDNLTIADSADCGITIRSGTSNDGAIDFSDSTSGDGEFAGQILYDHGSNFMRFMTASSERLRIDSSGRLLLGTTTEGDGQADNFTIEDSANCGITIRSGTSNKGQIFFSDSTSGDGETIGRLVYSHSDNSMRFLTNSSEAIRINDSGFVGINTTSPVRLLHIHGSSQTGLKITGNNTGASASDGFDIFSRDDTNGIEFFQRENAEMRFSTNATERMRIDSSGRLLYGHSTSRSVYGIQAPVQIEGTQFESGSLSITCNNASDFPILLLGRSRGSSVGSNTAPTDGQVIGEVSFVPSDGTNMGAACVRIQGVADDNHAENDVPGRFVVQTVPSGSESSVERLRIHHGGKLTVPGVYSGTTTGGEAVRVESDGDLLRFTSSRKYKTDIETIEDARADAILNCRPVWYRSKCDNDIKTEGAEKSDWGWYGFIAEEVAEIEPRLVNWATKDAVEQENGFVESVERDPADYEAEGVRYDNFVPLLVNLVKRQQARIEALETQNTDLLARVTALEG